MEELIIGIILIVSAAFVYGAIDMLRQINRMTD